MVYYKYNAIIGPLSEKLAMKCAILNKVVGKQIERRIMI